MQQNLNEWVQKIKKLEGKLNAERKKTQELAGNLSIERKIRENERKENTRNYERVVELVCENASLNSELAKMREGVMLERATKAKSPQEARDTLEKRHGEKMKAETLRHQSALDKSYRREIELKDEVANLTSNNESFEPRLLN